MFTYTDFFMTANDRLKQVRDKTGLTQSEFGQYLGLSQGNIKDIEIGRKKVTPEIALEIESIYGVDFKWLLTGVDKGGGAGRVHPSPVDPKVPPVNPKIRELIAITERLPDAAIADLVKQAKKEELVAEIKKLKGLKPLGEAGIIGISFLLHLALPVELILCAVGLGFLNGPNALLMLSFIPYFWIISISLVFVYPVETIRYLKHRAVSFVSFSSPRFGSW
jgi:transcriptional regulator with XRE-family HTH domain